MRTTKINTETNNIVICADLSRVFLSTEFAQGVCRLTLARDMAENLALITPFRNGDAWGNVVSHVTNKDQSRDPASCEGYVYEILPYFSAPLESPL